MWLAKLTERGLLQPSFVPPPEIRRLREFTRLRADLVHERTRYWARLEKLLERALIKISAVVVQADHRYGAGDDRGADRRGAQPEGPRGPGHRQGARKRAELAEALDGDWQPHHGELARILLDQIDALTVQIDALHRPGQRADRRRSPPRGAWTPTALPARRPAPARTPSSCPPWPGSMRSPAAGIIAAQAIIAEIGLDMTVFGTPGRLVSWAKRCPQTRQSGKKTTAGRAGKGNPCLNGHPRRDRRRPPPAPTPSSANATGGSPAAAANARPWPRSPAPSWSSSSTCSPTPPPASTTSAPTTTTTTSTPERKIRNHIRQLEALGHTVTIAPPRPPPSPTAPHAADPRRRGRRGSAAACPLKVLISGQLATAHASPLSGIAVSHRIAPSLRLSIRNPCCFRHYNDRNDTDFISRSCVLLC